MYTEYTYTYRYTRTLRKRYIFNCAFRITVFSRANCIRRQTIRNYRDYYCYCQTFIAAKSCTSTSRGEIYTNDTRELSPYAAKFPSSRAYTRYIRKTSYRRTRFRIHEGKKGDEKLRRPREKAFILVSSRWHAHVWYVAAYPRAYTKARAKSISILRRVEFTTWYNLRFSRVIKVEIYVPYVFYAFLVHKNKVTPP